MTASKPKEDLIMVLDRPQSPDYTDMISPRATKKKRERKATFGQALSNPSQECV